MLLFNFIVHVLLLLGILIVMVYIFILMFMSSYYYVRFSLGILYHFVVLCIVCMYVCMVLLPPGVNPIAVNKYIKSNSALL